MGRIYRDLEKQPRFGFLPAMASCGQIGARMAESFLRAHPQLHQAGGARSPPQSQYVEEYSMVVILRMNRAFMEYMRKHEKDYESIEFDSQSFAVRIS